MIEERAWLTAFYVLFLLAALVWPTVRVWRSTGINPLVLPTGDSVAGFVGNWLKLLITVLGLYLGAGALGLVSPVGPVSLPLIPQLAHLGMALMAGSFVWVVIAQWQMGASWRVGIDDQHRTDLVAKGLFRLSRNPIFLGMMVQLAGLFMVQPDAVTLSVSVAAFALISVQIRLEEAHLLAMHGTRFMSFRAEVRRWL
jgi:protein-S-isoprenylcysteine O-methyltransferase Ste14